MNEKKFRLVLSDSNFRKGDVLSVGSSGTKVQITSSVPKHSSKFFRFLHKITFKVFFHTKNYVTVKKIN